MSDASRGLVAGVLSAVVLAVLMVVVNAMGLVPRMDTIALLARAAAELFGTAPSSWVGWVCFFLIGAFWGWLFGSIQPRISGRGAPVRGAVFGAWAWLVMMVVFMPVAGAGWFGLELGIGAPLVALVGHLIFGAVMGVCFRTLAGRSAGLSPRS